MSSTQALPSSSPVPGKGRTGIERARAYLLRVAMRGKATGPLLLRDPHPRAVSPFRDGPPPVRKAILPHSPESGSWGQGSGSGAGPAYIVKFHESLGGGLH